MPDIVIVGVEGLKETKMTVPHEVLRQGVNVIKPSPSNAWWLDDDADPDEIMPYKTITCYDTGIVLAGRIVMAPMDWLNKMDSLRDPEPPPTSPSKVLDLDTDLMDDEFDLDDEDEEPPKDWLFYLFLYLSSQ